MALPFESAPATRLEKSGLARLGYQLSQQQKAEKQAERERYEEAVKSVGSIWETRDGGVFGGFLQDYMKIATDPKYFNAPIGSKEHLVKIRAEDNIRRAAETSGANMKLANDNATFARQQGLGNVEGIEQFNQYQTIPEGRSGRIDLETGNLIVVGEGGEEELWQQSSVFKQPPSLSKKRNLYSSEDFTGKINLGSITQEDANGVKVVVPKNARLSVNMAYGLLDKDKKLDLLLPVAQRVVDIKRDELEQLDEETLKAIEQTFLEEASKVVLNKADQSITRDSSGRGKYVDQWGVDRSNLSIKPVKGEGSYGFTAKEIRFVPETGDKSEMYFIDRVEFDDNGQMYVTGIKLRGDKNAAAMRAVEEGTAWEQIMSTYSMESEFVKRQPLNTSDQEELLAAVSDKHKALNSLKTLEDFRGWTADYARYSPSSNKQDKQEEVATKEEGDMTDEEYQQFLRENGLAE